MCLKICTLLGIGLAADPRDFFRAAHQRSRGASGTILRLLYYPPLSAISGTKAEGEDVRAGAHSDYGSMTMLFRLRGQAGLEILTHSNDGGDDDNRQAWSPVPVCPPGTEADPAPPILVNIGDLLSYWTNGLLRSTVHRVVFPGKGGPVVEGESDTEPRYSIAYFCHPVGTMPLTPVPSERVRSFKPPLRAAAEQGNPYAERKVMTADEHLRMRYGCSSFIPNILVFKVTNLLGPKD